MKLLATALAFFLASAFGAALPLSSATDSDVRELQLLENVWNRAHQEGDAAALESLWADDIEITVPRMAVMSRAEAVNFARSGRMEFLHYDTTEVQARVYNDAAVVSGRLQRTRSMGGRTVSDDWRFTKVYIRIAGRWRVVSFHASEAPQK